MKCKVCGSESGKYPLCRVCNIKKEKGEIAKCSLCGNWHPIFEPCYDYKKDTTTTTDNTFVYDAKKVLISKSEQSYFSAIMDSLPAGYHAFPQVNLASFIIKNDDTPFRNELFRNVDFLITNEAYNPLFVIEINDQTHLTQERKERDEKVHHICEEAGIPILNFWTSYGVNKDYIYKKIHETIATLPPKRIHHFIPTSAKTFQSFQNADKDQQNHTYQEHSYYNKNKRYRKSAPGCFGMVALFLMVIAGLVIFLL